MSFSRSEVATKVFSAWITVLFVLFAVMLPRYTDTAKTWYVLLILSAFVFLLVSPGQLRQTSRPERLFLLAICLNFAWIVVSFYVNDQPGRGDGFVWGRHFYFVFLVPVFFLFRRIELSDRLLIATLTASVMFSLGDMLIDIAQGINPRIQGMNQNAFGPIQLCLSGILLLYFWYGREPGWRYLSLAGFFAGIVTVVLSDSKSTWMTLFVVSALFVTYLTRRMHLGKRIAAVAITVIVLASSYGLPPVKSRIDIGLAGVGEYFASEDHLDDARIGSFGTRMELWRTAWQIFLERPWLGSGVGSFKVKANENWQEYRVHPVVGTYKYAHNQYLAALATRGIPGLILLLAVLGLPLYIAAIARSPDPGQQIARLTVMLICLNYLIGNLPEDHFEGKSATMFTSIFLAMWLARISPFRRAETADP